MAWFLPLLGRLGLGGAASAMGGIVSSAGAVLGGAFAVAGGGDDDNKEGSSTSELSGEGDGDGNSGGSISPPRVKQAKRVDVNEGMAADKLLKVAVNYLSNIDENLKAKIQYDNQLRRSDSAQAREESIEDDDRPDARRVNDDGSEQEEAAAKKTMNPMLIAIGALGAAIVAAYTAWENIDWGILGDVGDIASDWFNRGVDAVGEGVGVARDAIEDYTGVDIDGDGNTGTAEFDGGGEGSVGDRNNNPGNLRDGAFTQRQRGYVGPGEGGFAQFATRDDGLRAMARLLTFNYLNNSNFNTPTTLVERYAPANENSAASRSNYARYIADALGIDTDDTIDFDQVHELARAMREFETGRRESGPTPVVDIGPDAPGDASPVRRERPSNVREQETDEPEEDTGFVGGIMNDAASLLAPFAKAFVGDGSTIKSMTAEAPDFSTYEELYNRNMESTIDAQTGLTRDAEGNVDTSVTPAQQRLQRANGGSMDVIDPNYQVSENQVIANYLSTFGYNR